MYKKYTFQTAEVNIAGWIQCWVPNGGCYLDSCAIFCQIFSLLNRLLVTIRVYRLSSSILGHSIQERILGYIHYFMGFFLTKRFLSFFLTDLLTSILVSLFFSFLLFKISLFVLVGVDFFFLRICGSQAPSVGVVLLFQLVACCHLQ